MPTDPILSKTASLFDAYILKILENGGTKVAVTDDDGKVTVETVDLTPAMLSAIERRLHHAGYSGSKLLDVAKGRGDSDFIQRARAKAGLKFTGEMPPLSTEPDAATG